jgi:hypothetical protein
VWYFHSENKHSEDKHSDNCYSEDKHSISIGILIPSTTKYIDVPDLETLSLMRNTLPSIYVSIETKYHYTVCIAIEADDYLESVQDEIIKRFCFTKIIIVAGGSTFTDAVNVITEVAYDDIMTYFVRINDDTRFISPNWTSTGIKTLLGFIPKNVGVVGPTFIHANKKKEDRNPILTHDMVHRTHLDIFEFYYSPVFDNCLGDN